MGPMQNRSIAFRPISSAVRLILLRPDISPSTVHNASGKPYFPDFFLTGDLHECRSGLQ